MTHSAGCEGQELSLAARPLWGRKRLTLMVFAVFSTFCFKEPLIWNHALGFGFIALGAFFIFHKWA